MKKILIALLLFFCIIPCFGQRVPSHNIGATVSQMQQLYPRMTRDRTLNGVTTYWVGESYSFDFKDNKLISESTYSYGNRTQFNRLLLDLNNTSYKSKPSPTSNSMTYVQLYYYEDFFVSLSYWYDNGQIILSKSKL